MGCVAETITLSFAIFPLIDVIWEQSSLGYRSIFGALAFLVAISTGFSIILWPDAPYEVEGDMDASQHDVTREEAMEEQMLLSTRSAGLIDVEKIMSRDLKDQPFAKQLTSGVYVRLSIFFLVTSFWANFYIATVTTELGDQQRFDLTRQHELARLLSFIDAGAIVCAPLSGYLLDSVGFTHTAVITIGLGVCQMCLLLIAGSHEGTMVASFVAYAIFRAFLFPYFFASLSKKIGFRFFGVLSGMSFCISGFSQLAIAPLALRIEGDCHEYDSISMMSCGEGSWNLIHAIQAANLVLLLIVPVLDTRAEKKKEEVDPFQDSPYGSLGKGTELSDGETD